MIKKNEKGFSFEVNVTVCVTQMSVCRMSVWGMCRSERPLSFDLHVQLRVFMWRSADVFFLFTGMNAKKSFMLNNITYL